MNRMPGKIGFRLHAPWRRPDAALLALFAGASSSQVADCMSRLGAMDAGIKPVWTSPPIVGPALTVWCHSADNLMLHAALSAAQPGDIVVLNTQDNRMNAVFGELMASSALKLGVRGVIVDGAVRDAAALERLQLPVYARCLSPNGCNKDGAGEVAGIIACGGVAVRPGDLIVADRDGVAVVPLDDAPEVARLAAVHVQREADRLAEIAKGVVLRPEISDQLRRMRVID
jgi:4-hydroxy-4-methyl-2-oxoglutarate aldolase